MPKGFYFLKALERSRKVSPNIPVNMGSLARHETLVLGVRLRPPKKISQLSSILSRTFVNMSEISISSHIFVNLAEIVHRFPQDFINHVDNFMHF